jgi:hypothetical protein
MQNMLLMCTDFTPSSAYELAIHYKHLKYINEAVILFWMWDVLSYAIKVASLNWGISLISKTVHLLFN